MKVLLEMRPAFAGHSGIPQETRLLFRGLAGMPGIQAVGLLQSGNLAVEPGLPLHGGELRRGPDPAADIDRLSRVVVSLQQGPSSDPIEHFRRRARKVTGPVWAAIRAAAGLREPLTGFDPTLFQDWVWRSMFAKSLPSEDFEFVTRAGFRIMRWPWSMVHAVGVVTGGMGHALYPRLDTRGIDVMIAETPYPGRVSRGTRLVVRYHDAVPLLMPHTIKQRNHARAAHYHALRRNAADGAWFACVSESARQDLLSVMPALRERAVTVPNMVPRLFSPETRGPQRVPDIIDGFRNRTAPEGGGQVLSPQDLQGGTLPYLLAVSTIEPRKNHLALLEAWERMRGGAHPRLHLVCVGELGWDEHATLERFRPWLARGGLHLLHGVPAEDLRLLYRHAAATVCPSFAEGFGYSGLEALCSGGVVAASDIAVHREVLADAAEYFSPYSADQLQAALERMLGTDGEGHRQRLRQAAEPVSERYRPEPVLRQWQAFLERLAACG